MHKRKPPILVLYPPTQIIKRKGSYLHFIIGNFPSYIDRLGGQPKAFM